MLICKRLSLNDFTEVCLHQFSDHVPAVSETCYHVKHMPTVYTRPVSRSLQHLRLSSYILQLAEPARAAKYGSHSETEYWKATGILFAKIFNYLVSFMLSYHSTECMGFDLPVLLLIQSTKEISCMVSVSIMCLSSFAVLAYSTACCVLCTL